MTRALFARSPIPLKFPLLLLSLNSILINLIGDNHDDQRMAISQNCKSMAGREQQQQRTARRVDNTFAWLLAGWLAGCRCTEMLPLLLVCPDDCVISVCFRIDLLSLFIADREKNNHAYWGGKDKSATASLSCMYQLGAPRGAADTNNKLGPTQP